jgi:hypothetical protein
MYDGGRRAKGGKREKGGMRRRGREECTLLLVESRDVLVVLNLLGVVRHNAFHNVAAKVTASLGRRR